MLPKLQVGSAFGIKIYLHWTFFLLPLWVLLSTAHLDDGPGPLFYLAFTGAVFVCLILHELGHALMARCFGIGTRDITMYPIGGVARLERMSERPWEEFWIAVAGPAVNVVIALGLGALFVLGLAFHPDLLRRPDLITQDLPMAFLGFLLAANVILVAFNMLPAFPMDGGRVLRALLSSVLGQLQATRIAAAVATVLVVVMGLAALNVIHLPVLSGNMLLLLVAGFVFLAGQRELQMVEMRERARREEPLEVLPVRRPRQVVMPLDLQPTVTVYTWDSVNGVWVKEDNRRPPSRFFLGEGPG
jgi:Zn-dependent protease